MTPRRDERERYARRRRAALPAALAAFVALVVVTSAPVSASFAGGPIPTLTIVLPPGLARAPADAAPAPRPEPVADAEPAPALVDSGGDDDGHHTRRHHRHRGDTTPAGIRHVFLVVLADTDLTALSDAAAPYFTGTLLPKGTLLTQYRSIARGALANGVALISGQGPTAQTLADCPTYADVTPDTVGADGQQLGDGCVYPYATGTIADELRGAGLDWRAYVEDVGAGAAAGGPASCRHPALGATDELRDPRPGDAYATRRNPFAYFHSLIDDDTCAKRDVGLDALDADLARGHDAPALAYVVPSLCHDGRATPCAAGAPAGAAAADAFLAQVVPRILASPAYDDGGLLVITSDAAPPPPPAPAPPQTTTVPPPPPPVTTPTTTPTQTQTQTQTTPPPTTTTDTTPTATTAAAPSSCCEPRTYPNVGDAVLAGAARVGALLIGPGVRAGVADPAPANHFTLLRALSDLFALQPLGYAGASALAPLPPDVIAPQDAARG